ncbi:hypothetical protein Q3G72_015444 [Acer saccharum]|nr:hypothetical protein Q3G72_015444 [Acer saccharum]
MRQQRTPPATCGPPVCNSGPPGGRPVRLKSAVRCSGACLRHSPTPRRARLSTGRSRDIVRGVLRNVEAVFDTPDFNQSLVVQKRPRAAFSLMPKNQHTPRLQYALSPPLRTALDIVSPHPQTPRRCRSKHNDITDATFVRQNDCLLRCLCALENQTRTWRARHVTGRIPTHQRRKAATSAQRLADADVDLKRFEMGAAALQLPPEPMHACKAARQN